MSVIKYEVMELFLLHRLVTETMEIPHQVMVVIMFVQLKVYTVEHWVMQLLPVFEVIYEEMAKLLFLLQVIEMTVVPLQVMDAILLELKRQDIRVL